MPYTDHKIPMGTSARGVLVVIVILILFLFLFLPGKSHKWVKFFGEPLALILEVPLHTIASLQDSLSETWSQFFELQNVWEENQQLKQKIQQLLHEQNRLKEEAIVVAQFQKLWNYQQTAPMTTTPARIIGRNVSNWYRAIVIDKGSEDGIQAEMGVITEAGTVGRVVRVNRTTAVVLLLSDPNVAITGMIQTSRDEGIIQGTPQGTIQMKYLPPLSPVQQHDMVVTSGLTNDFPRGLPVGHIHQITKGATDLFQSAELIPIVNFSKLEGVLVITDFENTEPDPSFEQGTLSTP